MMKKSIALLLLPALLVLPACSSSTFSSSSDTSSAQQTAEFNDADVMFAQMMIPHHEQAIEMSDMALDPTIGASQQIIDLATQIKNAQDPEIKQMKDWLAAWNKSLMPDDGMDHSSMMDGMLSADELTQLGALTGASFDKAWTEAMIAHHKGAVEMAEDVLENGSNPDVRQLASSIIKTQQAEIETLASLLS